MTLSRVVLGLSVLLSFAQAPSTGFKADPPKVCSACNEWNGPHEPFRVFANTYYVGVAGLSSVLITSEAGLILLDGGLPQSAPIIDANIRKMGFRTEDVRLIVNSHAHYDHAGGIAALQRASGATVAASAASAKTLELGGAMPEDPQVAFGKEMMAFPPAKNVRVIKEGEVLQVGDLAITAHFTPGHTAGGTTWTWRSCEGPRCVNMVYADSLNAVSAPGFRFSGDATHPSLIETFRKSIAMVAALPCDILIAPHPELADLDGKRQRQQQGAGDAFIDTDGCRAYAAAGSKRLDARIAEETAKK